MALIACLRRSTSAPGRYASALLVLVLVLPCRPPDILDGSRQLDEIPPRGTCRMAEQLPEQLRHDWGVHRADGGATGKISSQFPDTDGMLKQVSGQAEQSWGS